MRIVTITSDNYVDHTHLLLESIRVWHPKMEVALYHIGATDDVAVDVTDPYVCVRTLHDPVASDETERKARRIALKIDVLLEQKRPFLYLDGDTLVLRPLDRLASLIQVRGWVSVDDHEPLAVYDQPELRSLIRIPADCRSRRSFNAGVLGMAPGGPVDYRPVLEQARAWSLERGPVTVRGIDLCRAYERRSGDQALLNLAWFKHFGQSPASAGYLLNQAVGQDGTIDLGSTIIHLCGAARKPLGATKLENHQRIWNAWPRGVDMTPLQETDWWRRSLPHPWPWLNQCTQHRHRRFVRQMRASSGELKDIPWLVIRDPFEAFLIDRDVLAEIDRFWRDHAHQLHNVLHRPTFHLPGHHGRTPPTGRRWQRACHELRSLLPI